MQHYLVIHVRVIIHYTPNYFGWAAIVVSFRLVSSQIVDAAINLIISSAFLASACIFHAPQLKCISNMYK